MRQKEACVCALKEKHERANSETECDLSKQLSCLDEVFEKAFRTVTPNEVSYHLRCKIIRDIMNDPVITPSGVTYVRSAIVIFLKVDSGFKLPLYLSQFALHMLNEDQLHLNMDKLLQTVNVIDTKKSLLRAPEEGAAYLITFEAFLPYKSIIQTKIYLSPIVPPAKIILSMLSTAFKKFISNFKVEDKGNGRWAQAEVPPSKKKMG